MSRRAVLATILTVLLLVAGIVPWTVSPARLAGGVSDQLDRSFGLSLAAVGRSSIAFLPVPRLKIDKATVLGPDGSRLVEGAQIRGQLRLGALLAGRFELGEVSLSGGRIRLSVDEAGPGGWGSMLAHARASLGSSEAPWLRRVTVRASDVALADPRSGWSATLGGLDLVVNWPRPAGRLDLSASAMWRGQTVQVSASSPNLAEFLAGRAAQVEAGLKADPLSITLSGDAKPTPAFEFSGSTALETSSVGTAARWLGIPVAGELDRPVSMAGEAQIRDGGVTWPELRLRLGADRLDGALAASWAPRVAVRATMAADHLDLGWLRGAAAAEAQAWADGRVDDDRHLDLRLSASEIVIGPLHIGDCAASLLAEEGRVDFSVLRATLSGGTLKGRLSTSTEPERTDLRGQVSFEDVDLGQLASDLGTAPILTGIARGQAAVETSASARGDLLGQLGGRATMSLRNGQLSGLERTGPARRAGWPSGRAAVEDAQLTVALRDGAGEIVEGRADGPAIKAGLSGRFSLLGQSVDIQATADRPDRAGGPQQPGMLVGLSGSWASPTLSVKDQPGMPAP